MSAAQSPSQRTTGNLILILTVALAFCSKGTKKQGARYIISVEFGFLIIGPVSCLPNSYGPPVYYQPTFQPQPTSRTAVSVKEEPVPYTSQDHSTYTKLWCSWSYFHPGNAGTT